MAWATVSSWSCFCWLYRASPSLATKNIIDLISIMTIWWCSCVEFSLVLLEEGVFCEYGFSVSALWCPLATPTFLLGFLLAWTWGISSRHCMGDRDQDHPRGKEMQKSKMAVWGGLTNSCEKKRSEKQRRKGKIYLFEFRVPKNGMETYKSLPQRSSQWTREKQ